MLGQGTQKYPAQVELLDLYQVPLNNHIFTIRLDMILMKFDGSDMGRIDVIFFHLLPQNFQNCESVVSLKKVFATSFNVGFRVSTRQHLMYSDCITESNVRICATVSANI